MAGKRHEHSEHGKGGGGAERQPGPPGAAAASGVRSRFREARKRRPGPRARPGPQSRGAAGDWLPGPGDGPGQVQGRVLREDRQLELPQLRARFDRQLVDQQRADGAVALQRVGLPTAAVQGEHQLPAESLPQRMFGDELSEFGAQGGVPPERQLRLDPVLDHLQAERFEPLRLEPGERLGLQVSERTAAPQRLRFPQQGRGPVRVAVRERLPPGGRPVLERVQVQLAVRDPQHVTGRPGEQPWLAAASPSASALRRRETWTRSIRSAGAAGWSLSSSSIRWSRETTRLAWHSSSASSARCLGPPIRTGVAPLTSSGPRIANIRRVSTLIPPSECPPKPGAWLARGRKRR